jgi:hypothetical protein
LANEKGCYGKTPPNVVAVSDFESKLDFSFRFGPEQIIEADAKRI